MNTITLTETQVLHLRKVLAITMGEFIPEVETSMDEIDAILDEFEVEWDFNLRIKRELEDDEDGL
ncbi:MAG: hypothetical protein LC650_04920 [Actinobacteria bacterium]|nr:hypothetical protein [Actinomycetota bacterium]